ncbi:MAG: hypothetical protein R3223_03110 [Longimicrobiales bacterium]|nr:hypothetical protein [Longimicrobiales bacterium]
MMARTKVELESGPRPEAMADVPGVGEISLTRAVVQYRDHHETELTGGRIEDIGLALVLEGRTASSAEAVDLGSGAVKHLDLSTELVVLDWVYAPTLDHVQRLLEARSRADEAEPGEGDVGGRSGDGPIRSPSSGPTAPARALETYCFDLARHVLARVGFGPLTRSTLLRIGFRDVCRDLDLHEGTNVRLSLSEGALVRARMDYDASALLFRTASSDPTPELEEALRDVFPGRDVRRIERVRESAPVSYQVRFPLPLSLSETRTVVAEMRDGLEQMLARFEPRRYRAAHDVVDALGSRQTLTRLRIREPRVRTVPVASGIQDSGPKKGRGPGPVSGTVH